MHIIRRSVEDNLPFVVGKSAVIRIHAILGIIVFSFLPLVMDLSPCGLIEENPHILLHNNLLHLNEDGAPS